MADIKEAAEQRLEQLKKAKETDLEHNSEGGSEKDSGLDAEEKYEDIDNTENADVANSPASNAAVRLAPLSTPPNLLAQTTASGWLFLSHSIASCFVAALNLCFPIYMQMLHLRPQLSRLRCKERQFRV